MLEFRGGKSFHKKACNYRR